MNYKEARLYLKFYNEIARKKHREIAEEIGIGATTVGDIIRGKYAHVNKKTLNKIENWKNGNIQKFVLDKFQKPQKSLFKRFLSWIGRKLIAMYNSIDMRS